MAASWTGGVTGAALMVAPEHMCLPCGPQIKLVALDGGPEQILVENGNGIGAVATDAAAGLLAFAELGLQPELVLVDLASGSQRRLAGPTAAAGAPVVYADLAFAADGRLLVTLESQPAFRVRLWEVATGALLAEDNRAGPGTTTPRRVVTHPSGPTFAVVGSGLTLYTIEQCQSLYSLSPTEVAVATLPKRKGSRSLVRRRSIEDSLNLHISLDDSTASPTPMDVVWKTAETAIATCADGSILSVNADDGMCARMGGTVLEGGDTDAAVLLGTLLVVGGVNGHLRWLNFAGDKDLQQVRQVALDHGITALSVLPTATDNIRLVASGAGAVSLVEPGQAGQPRTLAQTLADPAAFLAPLSSASGDVCVAVSRAGDMAVHDTTSGRCLFLLPTFMVAATTAAAASPTCPALALGSADGVVRVIHIDLEARSARCVFSSILHSAPVAGLAFDPRGSTLFSAGAERIVATKTADFSLAGFVQMAEAKPISVFAVGPTATDSSDGSFHMAAVQGNTLVSMTMPADVSSLPKDPSAPLSFSSQAIKLVSHPLDSKPLSMAIAGGFAHVLAQSSPQIICVPLAGGEAPSHLGGHVCSGAGPAATNAQGTLVAVGRKDGRITVRLPSSASPLATMQAVSGFVGGVAALAISPNGHMLMATSRDGFVAGWDLSAMSSELAGLAGACARAHEAAASAHAAATQALCTLPEAQDQSLDQSMRSVQMSAVDKAAKQATAAASAAGRKAQADLSEKIADLRAKLLEMIEANEKKPEAEQLGRDEFVLDLEERDRLEKESQGEVAKLREEIELQILAQQFLRNNIKQRCWDSMETVGTTLYAFDADLEVANYPLRRRSPAELRELQRVLLLRKTEIAQAKALKAAQRAAGGPTAATPTDGEPAHAAASSAAAPGEAAGEHRTPSKSASGAHASQPSTPADAPGRSEAAPAGSDGVGDAPGAGAGAGGAPAGDGAVAVSGPAAGDDDDLEEEILYAPTALFTAQRKRNQIVLLRDLTHQLRKAFNSEFQDVFRAKQEERARIADKNERIEKICTELGIEEELYQPKDHDLEHPERLLSVRDDEIKVEKVLNAEELKAKEEAERLEAERRAAEAEDNPRERGVQDMMDGRLEGRAEDDIWIDPPVPKFLDEVAEEHWSEEQKKEASDYQARQAELAELRDKRRKALDGELRKLQESIAAARAAFDARLHDLFRQKINMEQRLAQEELKILMLAKGLQEDEDMLVREKEIKGEVHELRAKVEQTQRAVEAAQEVVGEFQSEYEAMVAADRQLDKSFKTRREFADCDAQIDALYRLFKRRPKRKPSANVEAREAPVAPLDREADCPEGVSSYAWERLVELRTQKIQSEAAIRVKANELADMNAFLQRRVADRKNLDDAIQDALDELEALRRHRVQTSLNAGILILLKQGQVEIQHDEDFDPDFTGSVFIHRSVIEDLNQTVRKLAQHKIEHLQQKMELRKGIHMLEWEHKCLDMEGEDLKNKIREIQLLRVTKGASVRGNAVPEEERHRKEIETLEKSIQITKQAFERSANQRKRKIGELQRKVRAMQAENDNLGGKQHGLANEVDQRATVHRVHLLNQGETARAQARLQNVMTRRKLVETVRRQREELQQLSEELDRQRLRTFPSFPQNHRVPF